MSIKVADHSTSNVKIGAGLHAAGIGGVIRYASAGRGNVNITPSEVDDLKSHGISIGIVNEHAAAYLLGGEAVGKQRAHEAQQIARACNLEDGVVYMAGDFDATLGGYTHPGSAGERNMEKIHAALNGAADSIGPDCVGFYGSYFAIDWLAHHAPWIKYYWQTSAWSMKLLHPTADIYQGNVISRQPSNLSVGGVSLDGNTAFSTDWGQRTKRPVSHTPAGHMNADVSLLANDGRWSVHGTHSADAHFGDDNALYTVALGVYVGGPRKGQWVHKSMPKNWTPPGGW